MAVRALGDRGPVQLHGRDVEAVTSLALVRVFVNDSRWWQNASFALPLVGATLSLAAGWVFGSGEALGFGLFLAAIAAIMMPVVFLTWRGSATAIALCDDRVVALHRGRVLTEARWADLLRIERVEYLGNTRYKLVHGDDEFITVESEVEHADQLVDLAFELSGLPRQREQ